MASKPRRAYYGTDSLLLVAGSQAAIQTLPQLRVSGRVGVIHPGYAEHAHAWRRARHSVLVVSTEQLNDAVPQLDVLVLIHPNNPTGALLPLEQMLDWHVQLVSRGGWLMVDEAFIDATPLASLARYSDRPGLIVLRSLGKFFGLAGARVGSVLAERALLDQLAERLGPWTLTGPSRHIATRALADQPWQRAARVRLPSMAQRLADLLRACGLAPSGGCALFQWVRTPEAVAVHEALARQGILVRLFAEPAGLRFGLPGSEAAWTRIETGLAQLCLHRRAMP